MAQRSQVQTRTDAEPLPAPGPRLVEPGAERAGAGAADRVATAYSARVASNVAFLGARSREIAADEMDRTKSLDAKATAMIAASGALIAASATFAARLFELDAGSGAKRLWAVALGVALVLLLIAGAIAVSALVPKAVRTAVHIDDLETWPTPAVLEKDPILVEGSLMMASIHSIGHARRVNNRKARRLVHASWAFAGALASVVVLALSIAAHG